jgi:formylglycine-generating enzyme required for sulfatase activity/flavodoxin
MGENENLVLIKGGTFSMGSPDAEPWRGKDERLHQVTVGDFYIGAREVTQKEYRDVTGNNPSNFTGDTLPVENVTWLNAVEYCNLRSVKEGLTPAYKVDGDKISWDRSADGYRLPTEAEWERASRAGTNTPFNTGPFLGTNEANYYGHYPYQIEENYFSQDKLTAKPGGYNEKTLPVGSFQPNAYGLSDMHGNVREWVWDYYGEYPADGSSDPTGPVSGTLRVHRGGGWNDFAKNTRSAYRGTLDPSKASFNQGFRVARNASQGAGSVTVSETRAPAEKPSGKILIAYFSWGGNTRGIATEIQRQTGADLFEIKPEKAYPDGYEAVLDAAWRDQKAQSRPKLSEMVRDMGQYDVIILGYPNWWASIPMPIASFLEGHNLTGKTIIPFCSHGGGRLGESLSAISKLAPGATQGEPLSVGYSGGSSLGREVGAWLDKNNIKRR